MFQEIDSLNLIKITLITSKCSYVTKAIYYRDQSTYEITLFFIFNTTFTFKILHKQITSEKYDTQLVPIFLSAHFKLNLNKIE